MDLRSIYISNGVGIVILLLLMYVARTKVSRRSVEDRLFALMVLGVMVACFMEAFSYTIDGRVFAGSRVLNYIANTYLYCVNLLLPFCVLVYIDYGLYGDTSRILKKYKPQIVIGAIMLAVNIVNFFVPVSYYITDQNVYERKPFSYAYYFVILYFLITAIVVTRRYERENGTRTFFNVMTFLLPILLGAGLQFAFYGLSLAWLSAAIGLAGLFMMQQNEMAYIDALVDTYNRQYLNHVLSSWISQQKKFAGAMFDVDGFKGINDKFGHTQGDAALKTVTGILKKSCLGGERVFRFAGDEFIVLKATDSPDALDAYLANVNENLDRYNKSNPPYPLSLSYGKSFFEEGNLDEFIKRVDNRMYEMKKEHHAGASNPYTENDALQRTSEATGA